MALAICGSAIRAGGWLALSQVVTIAYDLAWVAIFVHHCIHLYEGYLWDGLALRTLQELALVVAWGFVAVALHELPDPKLTTLAVCWLLSAALLFRAAYDMEAGREKLIEKTGYRPRRATDVIRQSGLWGAICNLFDRVDDEKVDVIRTKASGADTEDGNLSATIWLSCCSAVAVGLIATAGAFGNMIAPEDSQPSDPPNAEGSTDKPADARSPGAASGGPGGGVDRPGAGKGDGEEDCEGTYDPGAVPEPSRRALILAWTAVDGLLPDEMEALGYDVGGCPLPARPIPRLTASWYAPAFCDGDLRAIAVALAGEDHPRVLLEQAAEFTLPLIVDGRFLSAEDRFPVGSGDAYIVHTRDGSFVLIRDDASAGRVGNGERSDGGGCGEHVDRDVAYTVAGPGLLEAWRAVSASYPGGIYPIASGIAQDGHQRVALRSTASGIVTVLRCSPSLLSCEGKIGGVQKRWSDPETISRSEVEALALP